MLTLARVLALGHWDNYYGYEGKTGGNCLGELCLSWVLRLGITWYANEGWQRTSLWPTMKGGDIIWFLGAGNLVRAYPSVAPWNRELALFCSWVLWSLDRSRASGQVGLSVIISAITALSISCEKDTGRWVAAACWFAVVPQYLTEMPTHWDLSEGFPWGWVLHFSIYCIWLWRSN